MSTYFLSASIAQIADSTNVNTIEGGETVEAISGVSKLVHEYGSEIVIISVFILLLIAFCIFILKMVNKMFNEISSGTKNGNNFNQEIITKILDDYLEKKNQNDKKEKHDEIENKQNTLVSGSSIASMTMNDASRIVMGKIHCDRIGVYVFHNGNKTQFGFPFVRMSCVNEFTMKGMSTTIRGLSHSGLPLHAFSNIVRCLIDNGEYIIGNVYDHGLVSGDEQIIKFISGSPIQYIFALAINDDRENIAAFTVAEFREAQNFSDHDFYDKVKNSLEIMNESIRSIVISKEFRKSIVEKENEDEKKKE